MNQTLKTSRALTIAAFAALSLGAWAHGDEEKQKPEAGHHMEQGMPMGHGDHGAAGHAGAAHGHEASGGHGHASMMGEPGDPAKVSRTVMVDMADNMRFTPANIDVKVGETIRFFVKNSGQTTHEMVLGNLADLKAHAEMMRSMPNMAHNEPNMTKLNPGQRGGMVWHFTQPGVVDFACTVPGHLEAGMKGTITVK